ncbi:CAP domain-containing protein [Arthrobacter sp. zg-Y238]|uniref:CAP and S-layer homology domain-containing protein n=1 Tax=Arthrobacter sp. zg-Y238 TaxID=2964614 RepID=UPI002106918E|nr:CAP domain-containing protein [Arthrobacter sp. zg-Y238]MCQ1953684.1 S-layer homology domain-containing protein [Arthrobacter sp. zg-Y238]
MVRFKIVSGALVALLMGISALIAGAPAAVAETESSMLGTPAPSTLNLENEEHIVDTFNYVNKFRTDKGLEPLTFNVTVSEMAEDWSDTMESARDMWHNPGYYTDERVVDRWTAAGENVAYTSNGSGEAIVFGWEMSPGHNKNMSRPEITTMGVGIAVTGDCVQNSKDCYIWATLNLFDFHTPPAGTYRTAQDYFDGRPSLDVPYPVVTRASAPTFDDQAHRYSIPTTTGVDYYVDDVAASAGTYSSTSALVRVAAVAEDGYKLLGRASWWHDFPNALQATPAPVVFTDKDGTAQDTFTIPSVLGVDYQLHGETHEPGTYPGSGTVTVTAKPAGDGYVLTPGATDKWVKTFSKAPLQATPAAVVFTDKDGTAHDTYTIPSVEGVDYQVGGKTIATGTYPGTDTVTVTAKAATGYFLVKGGITTWTNTFSKKSDPYTPPVTSPFADVSTGQQFYKEMAWLAEKGISTGWTDANGTRSYRPLQPINRDAMAAFLYRAAGSPPYNQPSKSPFADVSTGQQFYKEMAWLADQGISTGWTEANGTRTYRPSQSINRDAMAAFLYRAAGSPMYAQPSKSPFADVSTGQQFYKEMAWLAEKGISTGWTEANGTRSYRPLESINRDAMAAFLYRYSAKP